MVLVAAVQGHLEGASTKCTVPADKKLMGEIGKAVILDPEQISHPHYHWNVAHSVDIP